MLLRAVERKQAVQEEVAAARLEASGARRMAQQAAAAAASASAAAAAATAQRRAADQRHQQQARLLGRAASAPRSGGRDRFSSSSSSSSEDDGDNDARGYQTRDPATPPGFRNPQWNDWNLAGPPPPDPSPQRQLEWGGYASPPNAGSVQHGAASSGIWGADGPARAGRRAFRLPTPREGGSSGGGGGAGRGAADGRRARSFPASPQQAPPLQSVAPLEQVGGILGAAMLAAVEQALSRNNPAQQQPPLPAPAPHPRPPQRGAYSAGPSPARPGPPRPPSSGRLPSPLVSSLGARYSSSSSSLSSLDDGGGRQVAEDSAFLDLSVGTPQQHAAHESRIAARALAAAAASATAAASPAARPDGGGETLRILGAGDASSTPVQSPLASRALEEREVASAAAEAVAKAQAAMRELELKFSRGGSPEPEISLTRGQQEAQPGSRPPSVPASPARPAAAQPQQLFRSPGGGTPPRAGSVGGGGTGSPAGGGGYARQQSAPSPLRAASAPHNPPQFLQQLHNHQGEGDGTGAGSERRDSGGSAAPGGVSPSSPSRARRKLRGDMDWLTRRNDDLAAAAGGEGGGGAAAEQQQQRGSSEAVPGGPSPPPPGAVRLPSPPRAEEHGATGERREGLDAAG